MQKPLSYNEAIREKKANETPPPSYEEVVRPGSPEPQPPIIEPVADEEVVRPGSPESQPPIIELVADVKRIDSVIVPGQEDMPPPIPAHYLEPIADEEVVRPGSPESQPPIIEPVADVKRIDSVIVPGQEDMPPPIPAQDQMQIGGKESVETKLIFLDNRISPGLSFYNYYSANFDILDKLRPIVPEEFSNGVAAVRRQFGQGIGHMTSVLIREVFSIKTTFYLINGARSKEQCDKGLSIEDALDRGYRLTKETRPLHAVFTAGNPGCKYDSFFWQQRDEEVQLKTQHLESKVLDDPETLKIIIQDTVEKILVNCKILPPKTSIGLLAALKFKLIEAIQQAASNTSDLNKRASLEKHCETLMCGKDCDVQLTYDQLNTQVELLRVMLESAKGVACAHSNLAFRALSHFSLVPGTSSFIASEKLFNEAEDILSRLSSSFENNGDSKSMSSGR